METKSLEWRSGAAGEAREARAVSLAITDATRTELLAACEADDCLGFDTRLDAARAVLDHDDWRGRWDCSDRLVAAVEAYKRARAASERGA